MPTKEQMDKWTPQQWARFRRGTKKGGRSAAKNPKSHTEAIFKQDQTDIKKPLALSKRNALRLLKGQI